jgi:FdhE protein
LGEYRGLEQTCFLRCGLCAAEWEFPRLCCPFCGNRDYRQLGYLHVEGQEGKERAATCEACSGYVKMLATITALNEPQLLVAEVATLPLDLAATERGFFVG